MKIDRHNIEQTTSGDTGVKSNVSAGGHVRSYGMERGADQASAPYQGQMQSRSSQASDSNLGGEYAQRTYGMNLNKSVSPSSAFSQTHGVHAEASGMGTTSPLPQSVGNAANVGALGQAPGSKKKKPKSFWIAIIVAILCIALACVLALTMFGNGKSTRQGDAGQLANKTDAEIQAELDRVVEEGMFNISIASTVQFADGASEGELRIENVPGNHYLMRVEITRDDTGEVIYTTDFIEPNHHIQSDTLDVDLPKGDYDCTATFFAYDEETEELIGQAAAKVNIEVLG